MPLPTLHTDRLVLRPFTPDDIPTLVPLIGAREIAATTRSIPHPYTVAHAEKFIENCSKGEEINLAIVLKTNSQLVGGGILRPSLDDLHAEVGYWIALPYWRQGFATEAARALVSYAFDELKMNRVYAFYMSSNPASGEVLKKLGLKHEGTMRKHQRKWGEYVDIKVYGMLREEWLSCAERKGTLSTV